VSIHLPNDHVIADKFDEKARIGVTDDQAGIPGIFFAMTSSFSSSYTFFFFFFSFSVFLLLLFTIYCLFLNRRVFFLLLSDGWMGLDIGPSSRARFSQVLAQAQTVLWNGPMGVFEKGPFAAGTLSVMVFKTKFICLPANDSVFRIAMLLFVY
jgi:hypothetical protein